MKTSDILNLAVLGTLGTGAWFVFDWWKKNKDRFTPKSQAEKAVDILYGPTQGWRTRPVYNTPGTAGYLPNLPASYPPGTPAARMSVPPGKIETVLRSVPSSGYEGYTRAAPVSPVTDKPEGILFGMGRWL